MLKRSNFVYLFYIQGGNQSFWSGFVWLLAVLNLTACQTDWISGPNLYQKLENLLDAALGASQLQVYGLVLLGMAFISINIDAAEVFKNILNYYL